MERLGMLGEGFRWEIWFSSGFWKGVGFFIDLEIGFVWIRLGLGFLKRRGSMVGRGCRCWLIELMMAGEVGGFSSNEVCLYKVMGWLEFDGGGWMTKRD